MTAANQISYRDLTASIAAQLGATIVEEGEGGTSFVIALPEAAQRLSFSFNLWKQKDRIVIRAKFPRDENRQEMRAPVWFDPVITVSIAKPAEQVARDVQRRMLTDYPKALAEIIAILEQRSAKEIADRALLTELAGVAGQFLNDGNRESKGFRMYDAETAQHAELRLLSDSVAIDIRRISTDKAKRIVAILAEV